MNRQRCIGFIALTVAVAVTMSGNGDVVGAAGEFSGGWHQQSPQSSAVPLVALACTSTKVCYAVGADVSTGSSSIEATKDDGKTWLLLCRGVCGTLRTVVCPDMSLCLALLDGCPHAPGTTFLAPRDSGRSWTTTEPAALR
jgi:hypothetical protein